MSQVAEELLADGRNAVERHAWQEAFDLLSRTDATAPLAPNDLEGLAQAAWWTGRLDVCIAARERAFGSYMEAGENRRAALVAMALAKDYYAKASASIGTAWLNRAERLLADEPECVELGYLERLRSVIAHEGHRDFERALEHGRRAHEIGLRLGDRDLQAVALHDQGRAFVAKGEVAEGMALIDEATAAAVSGELTPYHTAVVYCNTITACKELADWGRAGEWTEAAKRWCERQAIAGFPGMCRVCRASIMVVRGAWREAELEARRACDELTEFNVGYAAEAFYELGEIRLRMGDATAAEEAFRRAHELGRDPQPGLALLRLAEGKNEAACACIEQALDDEPRDLHRARLLPAQVEIAIAAGDLEKGRRATGELEAIAKTYKSKALEAAARSARSCVALGDGDPDAAAREARQALRLWQGVNAPYEAATSRMLLASAYLGRANTESAVLELEAAASSFDRLGAAAEARRAREQLEALGRTATLARDDDRRVALTFMFTDIVRSTKLVDAIGDDAWADLVRWHDETLRSVFATHEGEEIDHAGDGFFVAFPSATAAIESAVAVQRTLAAHRRAHGFAPQVRIGLHTAEASRRAAGYRGRGVHETARISALAEGGEILASRRTVDDRPLRFPVSNPRTAELEGVGEPIELVSIDWR